MARYYGVQQIVNARKLLQNFVVPEPKDRITVGIDESGAARVGRGFDVLAAVKLDNQHQLTACEVRDEGADRILPNELETLKTPIANDVPKHTLRFRHGRA